MERTSCPDFNEWNVGKDWLRSYPSEVPHRLTYSRETVPEMLKSTVDAFPHHGAISYLGVRITYQQLWTDVTRFADALVRMGLCPGDAVCIMLPNCPQAVIAFYGILHAGAVVVMANPLYVERELQYQLQDSGAKIIVALDQLQERVMGAIEKTKIEQVIFTGAHDYLTTAQSPACSSTSPVIGDTRLHRWLDVLGAEREKVDFSSRRTDDVALIQYTGGTTGTPKGVMLTHGNINANTQQIRAWFYRFEPGKERVLCVLPFFHVYGLTMGMHLGVAIGAELILLPRFDSDRILEIIAKERPTMFPGTPTMYIALINHPKVRQYNLSSIKGCISGAAGLPVEVQQRFEELTGGRVVEGYGLTEASPVTHCIPLWHKRKAGSIGLPLPDTEAKIVDPETAAVIAGGEVGELVVKGPQVMKGYWNRPDETSAVLRDGWLFTGDLAYMDEDGFFHIVGRKKDIIIAGGYNIYPREVEEVLFEHPGIQEAVVVGVPDPYRGETVKAYIVRKAGIDVSVAEIEQFCRSNLASYKVPRAIEFRTALPKTLSGKILRRQLLEEEKEVAAKNIKNS
ncbi:long-chain-fatty-acid-coa ligase [Heliomicrobium modesticaldum Ice1]|uniref:Long-chain-fatty-acid-coa ligase n=1 Tax=Heliobacterium modesticaldum (strain ATCC 51547 / Ice1) TaxID=498761 RepID=B0TI27_HELMI|nr:long-chain fatty acid--CoA ligase [Heliomicrobium modesticaldum]ABZ82700.1 long-chain-fatty-acid-coa ligase [Heliomicrobium modesticaldum Ice1]